MNDNDPRIKIIRDRIKVEVIMRTTDNLRNYNLRRENTVMEHLSSTKRKYIENWRQNVSVFMENGNICKVTIGEVTPEPRGDTTKWTNVENLKSSTTDLSSRPENSSPSLPAVKLAYVHGMDENSSRTQQSKSKTDRSRDKSSARPTLPPSPTGFVVHNGSDLHQAYKKRTSAMRSTGQQQQQYTSELPEVTDTKEVTRRSSKLAREIYEKYNMKSATHSTLPGKTTINGMDQYSMPWRNKTFLSLPLRFNGNIHNRNSRLAREKTNVTELKYDVSADEDYKYTREWNDLRNW